MTVQDRGRLPISSKAIAEVVFLIILIWMLSGPISGMVLTVHTWASALFTKSAYKVESTKNLAKQLLEASNRIKTLEKQLADNQLELTRLRNESKDTEKLRAVLQLKSTLERNTVAADVITRNPDNWFQQVTIDKGALDHITIGSAVITADGVVGQVIGVSDNASVVRLLTDPDQKLGVLITRLRQPGVLSGRGKSPAVIDFIPVGTSVEVGDKVVCLGTGGVFPSGHPVGTVAGVRRDTDGTTLSIEIRLAENLLDLRQVLVVPPQDTLIR
ncbi:MAG: rod shape-determining protein MreC [Candidatus Melainabacteria bacterium]|nr:rod shape-determining protein MreC [Candidatus Melainabacteria bacterium]